MNIFFKKYKERKIILIDIILGLVIAGVVFTVWQFFTRPSVDEVAKTEITKTVEGFLESVFVYSDAVYRRSGDADKFEQIALSYVSGNARKFLVQEHCFSCFLGISDHPDPGASIIKISDIVKLNDKTWSLKYAFYDRKHPDWWGGKLLLKVIFENGRYLVDEGRSNPINPSDEYD